MRVLDVRRGELAPLAWALGWFFCVLFGYYVLRPVRETMGIAAGPGNVKWLLLATFLVMLAAVPVYSGLVAHLKRPLLLNSIYHFFALNLLGFWFVMREAGGEPPAWMAQVFFVWVSVFNLFSVSIFWSVLADVFSSDQGKRLFGFIAGGGTFGALCGSLMAERFAVTLGLANLLLVPAAMLEIALLCGGRLQQAIGPPSGIGNRALGESSDGTGGSLWAGFASVARSRYLLGVAGYTFFNSLCGTTVYLQQLEIVRDAIADKAPQTRYFARVNLVTQILILVVQSLLAGPLIRLLGVAVILTLLPLTYVLGLPLLAAYPVLAVLTFVEVLRRVVVFGLTSPVREVLFTVVPREDKYKAKSFIDTAVFRGGDALTGQVYDGLRGLGMTLSAIGYAMIPAAVLWGLLGGWLGRRQSAAANKSPTTSPSHNRASHDR
jgi:AAA family ATP:ADP antiporter